MLLPLFIYSLQSFGGQVYDVVASIESKYQLMLFILVINMLEKPKNLAKYGAIFLFSEKENTWLQTGPTNQRMNEYFSTQYVYEECKCSDFVVISCVANLRICFVIWCIGIGV